MIKKCPWTSLHACAHTHGAPRGTKLLFKSPWFLWETCTYFSNSTHDPADINTIDPHRQQMATGDRWAMFCTKLCSSTASERVSKSGTVNMQAARTLGASVSVDQHWQVTICWGRTARVPMRYKASASKKPKQNKNPPTPIPLQLKCPKKWDGRSRFRFQSQHAAVFPVQLDTLKLY